MIASKTEIKAILAMTSTTQDDLIDRLIPVIDDDIRQYCNNAFRDSNVYISSGEISFTHNSTAADVISLDIGTGEDGFAEAQFKDGQTVQVLGSYNNDGFFEVESVASTSLTLYSSTSRPYYDELVTEDEDVLVTIAKVQYPKALQMVAAQMVNYRLANRDYGVKSETVSRYSVTYTGAVEMSGGYPKSLMSGLNKWRNPKFA